MFFGCESPADQNPVLGVIKNFSGVVYYHPADSVERLRLQNGDIDKRPLFPLDKLVVGENSFFHMYLYGHGDFFLEPNTTILLQRPDPSSKFQVYSKLLQGTIDCFVEKQSRNFAIQTPVAVAGVLGTSFQLFVDEEITRITLIESEAGIELQNLEQNLSNPLVLRSKTGQDGEVFGQQVELTESPVDGSASNYQIRSDLQGLDLKYPYGAQNGRLLYRTFTETPGTRTQSYER